jgi:uncharacterized membrane protein
MPLRRVMTNKYSPTPGPSLLKSVKIKAQSERTLAERAADWMTNWFGTMPFLIVNVAWFLIWIWLNTHRSNLFPSFDPFPFNFLTMMVSLEAIVLAIVVLISQNRAGRLADLREETHLNINVIAEQEVTKILKMLRLLLEKQGMDISKDPELRKMLEPVNAEQIEEQLKRQIT